jgi:mono/diheme cytochrome c family protein
MSKPLSFPPLRKAACGAFGILLAALALTACFDPDTGASPKTYGIVNHPVSDTVVEGGEVQFSAINPDAIGYAWIRDDSDTLPELLPVLTLGMVTLDMNGTTFKCRITFVDGSTAVTRSATLTVRDTVFTIVHHPVSRTVDAGGSAHFSAANEGAVDYQWIRDDTDTLDANLPTLTLNGVSPDMNGSTYKCKVTFVDGSTAVTQSATLTVRAVVINPCKDNASLCTPRAALRDTGEAVFQTCAGCHGMGGEGGRGPALANSDFFMNNRLKVINLVLRGNFDSPAYLDTFTVNGEHIQGGGMPGWKEIYTDVEIAGVLTYLRSVLNDSTVISCNPNVLDGNGKPTCVKQARNPSAMDVDSVAAWEVKAVRDTLPPSL